MSSKSTPATPEGGIETSQGSSNPLSRKLNKILETRLENDKDALEALKALSTFFTDNNLRSRRKLRGDIERRSLAISEQFADAFSVVTDQLDSINQDVEAMNNSCQDMTKRLELARDQTSDLINKTTDLQKEGQRLDMRARVADAFLAKYQLKPEEARVLRGTRDGQLQENFFHSLTRIKQIHNDCKVLLRTNQQTAGLEIMESMALHQETAYERLYRWTQGECRSMTGDSFEVTLLHCKAMEALQDRPVLFRYALDEFGTARRTAMVRGFIDALTRGGRGGTPRPIELHSHDPMRYVGDMLAWLHQASASEKEHLDALLRLASAQSREEEIQEILSHITEGICRPFKVRVEQVIVAEPGPVLLYKLTNIHKFYRYTIGQLLSKEASLLATLEEMEEFAQKVFFNALNVKASKLVDKVELPPADLGPTGSLTQTLSLLREILTSHDSSVVSMDTRQADFAKILGCVLDPLLQMCSLSASKLNPSDMAAYMINCLYAMQTTLSLYEYTDQRLEMLEAQVDAHVDTLVNEQASFVLTRVGLLQIYSIAQQHLTTEGPLSSVHGMDSSSVRDGINRFDSFLGSPDSFTMPQIKLLHSTTVREKIHKRAVALICSAYELLHTAINHPANDYTEPGSIVKRTPDQIKSLVS
ncbi:conserved oligomeric Golgi complex subunit 6 [Strongylocentrotus purpuratus]|uniref:Conserved oligomeric Golgi complex subunit 6 n=1 Tax=Strongylocentrotus purpuratus TaxID=7668 RepID=A0A7M7NMD8_STRPU|nr:conserved oligomeric Golgi complex subunit 6 [Strongylocentrotus purpuratus]|eukprot:XP_011671592.1 PREDICTED: conserved oligomeric Golgi complex subunit 6 isoform X1 [Strongylocentrotus purpuratus]